MQNDNPCPKCGSTKTYSVPFTPVLTCDSCKARWCHGVIVQEEENDPVNHPKHYTSHPSGIEVIEIVRWEGFNRGNAIKYILRAGKKDGADEVEDLRKARFYLDDEISRIESLRKSTSHI